ncbi:glycosyltransferase family 2 protein [Geomonas paludis]|uniref:Glycosyl transferase family 2 n=1 Tax=Geomonas paludis TaxID=2740185 RepID=A0A6V8MX60_9BACT|nr:glycosyltransferase family 2 protein [Geomonas paludis]UPU37105.1 glycosyltransferase family 2 protein [Geomonas paludis]GFO64798.1 glycosyl transferase family 2 [Geomonas paludis]
MRILAIIPAYNEARNITAVIEDLKSFRGDILVVNDGSTDETAAIAKSLGAEVVSHPFNLGIGGTVQTGLRYAYEHGYDMAIQFDGDGQHRGDQVFKILELVQKGEADLVIGSRTLPGGYKMGITRFIGSRIFHCLIRCLAGKAIHDPTSGFRCYGKKTIRLFSRFYTDDYPEVESIITAARNGLRVVEVPVLMRGRLSGHSSITRRKSAYYMLKVTLAMVVDAMRGRDLVGES